MLVPREHQRAGKVMKVKAHLPHFPGTLRPLVIPKEPLHTILILLEILHI